MQLTVDHGIGSPGRVGKHAVACFVFFSTRNDQFFFFKSQDFYAHTHIKMERWHLAPSLCEDVFLNRPWDRFWPHRTELPAIEFRLCFEVNVFLVMFFESQTLDVFSRERLSAGFFQ